jgi:excisionase family DNA binding protein
LTFIHFCVRSAIGPSHCDVTETRNMPKPVSAAEIDLLTAEQVIERLLDADLRRLAATCVLPAVKSGGHWRFRRADLDEWIQRQRPSNEARPEAVFMAAPKRRVERPS